MPFDGSGTFLRVMNWVNDAAANIKIRADRHDQEDNNFASGMSNTITKDGQTQPTANLPMGGKRHTNAQNPVDPQDYATKNYVDTADTAGLALKADKASPTFTGKVTLPTGVAGTPPMNWPNATAAPSAPANGDIWPDSASAGLKHRLAGITYTYGRLEATQTWTAQQIHSGVTGNSGMATATSGLGEIMMQGNGTGAAMATFHRPGAFAAYFGIDTDNKWKVGGWSMGAAAYEIVHMGNYTSLLDARYVENSGDNLALGAAGFGYTTYVNDGTKSSGTYTPTNAGGNIRAINNGGAFTWAADAAGSTGYTLLVAITNTATAGAITFSGFNAVLGDVLTTANGSVFMASIIKLGSIKVINIQALQ